MLSLNPRTTITKHYNSLQEHANGPYISQVPAEDHSLTPRHESRREGFTWDVRPTPEDGVKEHQRTHTRDPLPPERLGSIPPPSLQEIIRRATNMDVDSVHEIKLQHANTNESQPSNAQLSTSSTLSESPSTRRSSIAAFAKGLARRIPDMRMFVPPEPAVTSKHELEKRGSQVVGSVKECRKNHKSSHSLPSAMKSRGAILNSPKPSAVTDQPSSRHKIDALATQSAAKGSLRDRRKVKLDISMPAEIYNLPNRGRSPAIALNSFMITPSRPRSPQTPWVRSEPAWELHRSPKSAPIMEEISMDYNFARETNPGITSQDRVTDKAFSSQSPKNGRPTPKVRDRCYKARPRFKRSRSGRSGTSESTVGQSLDDTQSPTDSQALQDHLNQTSVELQQLSHNTNATRSRRWRFKASSDEALLTPESPNRRFSINLFKRSSRIPDKAGEKNNTHHPMYSNLPWVGQDSSSHGLHVSSPLVHIPVPPAFVPPGVHRVPTPPIFDTHGEVKGKLANFFFDVHGPGTPMRKPKTSPGGFWDSDALLMSMTTGIDTNEDEDEGPEGRAPYVSTPTSADFATTGTSRLMAGPSRHLRVKGQTPEQSPNPILGQDSWLAIHHDNNAANQRALTIVTLKEDEEEERRFEWLIPEHLPNSPICPLHPIYRGPYKGVCYWHGRGKSNGKSSSGPKGKPIGGTDADHSGDHGMRWKAGVFDIPLQELKKRRLVSLSSP
ncbi:hypothetical protein BKA66DRAFT_541530 [Pyrenochaeta sp. MPI-SDFR-AT-0127]|nr:hypothetical protein BKA66DRAFT_541530 [Pyrenochaeta sp. MPI-SDFR-AT-0127]